MSDLPLPLQVFVVVVVLTMWDARSGWVLADREARSHSGHDPLIEQGETELNAGSLAQPSRRYSCSLSSQSGFEQVRAQVPDEPVFVRGGRQCHVVQEKTHCYSILRGQHSTGLVVWSSPPLPGLVKVPGAIHPEMRVQASSVIETGKKVLADAVYAEHGPPRQIMFGEPRMAQFPPGEALAA